MKNMELSIFDLNASRDRFLEKVRRGDDRDCWPFSYQPSRFPGASGEKKPPLFLLTNTAGVHGIAACANRCAMFYLAGRLVDPSEDVLVTCGRRDCVNPAHLKVVPAGTSRRPR